MLQQRLPARLVRRRTSTHVVIDVHLHMRFEFFREFAVALILAARASEPSAKDFQDRLLSLIPQRHHRIDARCAPRRNPARSERHREQNQHYRCERKWIGGAYAEKHRRH